MHFPHPLNSIGDGGPMLAAFVALFLLALFTASRAAARKLWFPETPRRAIDLELAYTEQEARRVIGVWERAGLRDEVYRHLIWDNVFILCYSTLAALGCVMAARAFFGGRPTAYGVALFVAWLPWLAGMFEYVENSAMRAMMGGFGGETLPRLGGRAATAKFAIMLPIGGYALAGAVAYIWEWWTGRL